MSKTSGWSPGGDVRSLIGRNERGKSSKQRVKEEFIEKKVRKINKVYYK